MSDPAATPPADTPIKVPTFPPASKLDQIKGLIGDLARPFCLYATATATAKVIWAGSPADVIGSAGLILGALYGAKVVENIQAGKATAQVQVAQAQASAPTP